MPFPLKTKQIKTEAPVNVLPEYTIRTMKDDLVMLTAKPEKGTPPQKLPIVPQKISLPSAEELVSKEKQLLEVPSKPKAAPVKFPLKLEKPKPIKKPKRRAKPLVVLIIILLILLGMGLFFYWQGQKNLSPSPQPGPNPQPQLPQPTEALISVDETAIISPLTQTSLLELLKQEAEKEQPAETLKRLAILKNEEEFLSLPEFFQKLRLSIPPYALAGLGENYTLVLYNRNGSKHLGLLTEIKNLENLKEHLTYWEQTMINDLKNFFITESPGRPATTIFQDNIYQGITIRYVNFPRPDLSIDYVIVNNVFVLSTNRELTYKIVDKLLKTNE